MKDGVEGISSRTGLLSLLPGVEIVKLKFDGRRLGGVGGLINNGDGGAELFFSFGATAMGAGVCARKLLSEYAVLIPRFLRFRGFFAGVVGRCSSKKDDESMVEMVVVGELSEEPVDVLSRLSW